MGTKVNEWRVKNLKIALGLVVRSLNRDVNIIEFLKNAKEFNHKIDEVIIAYSEEYNKEMVEEIKEYSTLQLMKINHNHELKYQLRNIGLNNEDINTLIYSKIYEKSGLIPYGKNRNNVVIKAIMDKMDVLFFVDDDVKPCVLTKDKGKIYEVEVDFLGEHLNYLMGENYVTSSDYTGFYIVPPMKFHNMEHLIRGLQKGQIFEKSFIKNHGYLTLASCKNRNITRTNKILGGNVAIRLDIFDEILPFFSSVYKVRDEYYLTRGEDTLLGLAIDKIDNKFFLDIDVKIFHDTFNDFPTPPNIVDDESVKDRFFYACMGWIGRNPFLNWLLDRDLKKYYERTRKALVIGAPAIAKYLDDKRFLLLPEALNESYKNLDNMIIEYFEFRNTWNKFIRKKK